MTASKKTPLHELLAALQAGEMPTGAWLQENAARISDLWDSCEDGVLMLTLLAFLRQCEDVVRAGERIVSAVEAAVPRPTVAQPLIATVRRWIDDGGLSESEIAAETDHVQFDIAEYVRSHEYDVLGAQIHLFSMIQPETDIVYAAEKLANCAGLALMHGLKVTDANREMAHIIRRSVPPLTSSDLASFDP